MNPDRLLKHFDQITEAPDAVPRLRRFILDLAVRGKLVPQDPDDEPAAELLKRIQKEKVQQVGARGTRKKRPLRPFDHDYALFDVPKTWEWSRLGEVSLKIHYGYTASANSTLRNVRLLRITDIQDNKVCWDSVPGCEIADEHVDQYLLSDGDILIARTRGTIGKSFLVKDVPVKVVFASYLIRVQGSKHLFDRYLKLFLESPAYWRQLEQGARGAGQPNVNGQTLGNMLVPLPPLAEQHRIVAKVDELMGLCDELEAAHAKREKRRDRLVAASLSRLTAEHTEHAEPKPSPHPSAFSAVPFFLNHLQRLIARPAHVHQLRQTILNLAVRGRLVPQDPKDEPAPKILARISYAKKSLSRDRKISGTFGSPDTVRSMEVPDGWEAVRFGEILWVLQTGPFGSSLHQQDYEEGGTPVVNPASIQNERIVPLDKMAVGLETLTRLANFRLQKNDIVMARRGEMGRCAVVTEGEAGWLCGTGSLILRFTDDISPRFVVKLMAAPITREYLGGASVGATMQNLNQSILREMLIGLPPLAEQHRIVAKVDELMALCDELESRLAAIVDTRHQLLEATLHEALAGAS